MIFAFLPLCSVLTTSGTFLIYALANFICYKLLMEYMIETRGLTKDQVLAMFNEVKISE